MHATDTKQDAWTGGILDRVTPPDELGFSSIVLTLQVTTFTKQFLSTGELWIIELHANARRERSTARKKAAGPAVGCRAAAAVSMLLVPVGPRPPNPVPMVPVVPMPVLVPAPGVKVPGVPAVVPPVPIPAPVVDVPAALCTERFRCYC
jgi:hypothetical protein